MSKRKQFVGAYSSQSLAEETINKYTSPNNNNTLVTREKDGVLYPYHAPNDFISDCPVGFKGC